LREGVATQAARARRSGIQLGVEASDGRARRRGELTTSFDGLSQEMSSATAPCAPRTPVPLRPAFAKDATALQEGKGDETGAC
jgi:hypothetical protein